MRAVDVVVVWEGPSEDVAGIDVTRLALRSVAAVMPWARRIVLVTAPDQAPDWLRRSHPDISLIHHDAIMKPFVLPSRSRHSVHSHLHRIPGISAQFVLLPAQTILLSPAIGAALFGDAGKPRLYLAADSSEDPEEDAAARLLDQRFSGGGPWPPLAPGPVVLDAQAVQAMCNDFAAAIAATRSGKGSGAAVAAAYLAAHYSAASGRADLADTAGAARFGAVLALSGGRGRMWWQLVRLTRRPPLTLTLRGSGEDLSPKLSPRARAVAEDWLWRLFPEPAPWEEDG
ncbi:MAG: hypothetical protein AAF626_01820 [Pseudomonadota bacterium]